MPTSSHAYTRTTCSRNTASPQQTVINGPYVRNAAVVPVRWRNVLAGFATQATHRKTLCISTPPPSLPSISLWGQCASKSNSSTTAGFEARPNRKTGNLVAILSRYHRGQQSIANRRTTQCWTRNWAEWFKSLNTVSGVVQNHYHDPRNMSSYSTILYVVYMLCQPRSMYYVHAFVTSAPSSLCPGWALVGGGAVRRWHNINTLKIYILNISQLNESLSCGRISFQTYVLRGSTRFGSYMRWSAYKTHTHTQTQHTTHICICMNLSAASCTPGPREKPLCISHLVHTAPNLCIKSTLGECTRILASIPGGNYW